MFGARCRWRPPILPGFGGRLHHSLVIVSFDVNIGILLYLVPVV